MSEIQYLDIPAVAKKGMNWNVFVGARRIGKTYGILKRFMEEEIRFLYLRRTEAELTTAVREGVFDKLNADLGTEYWTEYSKTEGSGTIYASPGKDDPIGRAYALSTIRKVRGIEFTNYDEVFLDEFIPEEGAIKHDSDGTTCIQAFETIFSNRELPPNPLPPMRVWMASNAIDLFDPILNALDLTSVVASLEINKTKAITIPKRSLYVYHGTEEGIARAKKQTSLYRMIGADSELTEHMLYGNFRGDYISLIKRKVNFREYRCIFDIDDKIFVYENKNTMGWYVSTVPQDCKLHYNSKVPFDLRKRFSARFQLLNKTNNVMYESTQLIEFIEAFLN